MVLQSGFRIRGDWLIKSNAESGTGYSDILIEVPSKRIGIIIEVKYAENGNLDAACTRAMHQIENSIQQNYRKMVCVLLSDTELHVIRKVPGNG